MRARYIPGVGIQRKAMPGAGKQVELPRGLGRGARNPRLAWNQPTGELVVRSSRRAVYRRRFYKG